MTGYDLRVKLTQQAYDESLNKESIEKSIHVNNITFERCLSDYNTHHKNSANNRGFIRAYHKPFFTNNKDNMGQTYQMGIVHIINRDNDINEEYIIDDSCFDFQNLLRKAILQKRHRLIDIYADKYKMTAKITPQRFNLDEN